MNNKEIKIELRRLNIYCENLEQLASRLVLYLMEQDGSDFKQLQTMINQFINIKEETK